jgi:hypothetical protein
MTSEAPKGHRGCKAMRFRFSEEQRKLIDSYLPAFEVAVRDLNPELAKCNDKLAKWKSATAETIMEHDLFEDIDKELEESHKGWLSVSLWHRFLRSLLSIFTHRLSRQFFPTITAIILSGNLLPLMPALLPTCKMYHAHFHILDEHW